MKNETVAVVLAIVILAAAGVGYVAGYANERTVTTTSTFVTTSTATTTSFGQMGAVMVANASMPPSAWSLSNPTVSFLQCGQEQTAGSGFITLNNTGNEPVNVTDLTIYLGSVNYTLYIAVAPIHSAQTCTISPLGSLTFYFSFHGPTPVCQGYTAFVGLSVPDASLIQRAYGYFKAFLGGTASC
jgi:hypothetical protein